MNWRNHVFIIYAIPLFFLINRARLAERKNVWRKYAWRTQALPDRISICKNSWFIKNVHFYFPSKSPRNKTDYLCMHSILFSSATNLDILIQGAAAPLFLPFISFVFAILSRENVNFALLKSINSKLYPVINSALAHLPFGLIKTFFSGDISFQQPFSLMDLNDFFLWFS